MSDPANRPARLLLFLVLAGTGATLAAAGSTRDAFIAENNAAMDKMMAAMQIKPSGDIDRDFTSMMIPHHQGAIEMAESELRYGHNEQLRRIAQEIVVEQQQEINAMDLALGDPLPPSAPAPTQPAPAPTAAIDAPGAMSAMAGMSAMSTTSTTSAVPAPAQPNQN